MPTLALQKEASNLAGQLSETQLFSAVMYMKFLKQQDEREKTDSLTAGREKLLDDMFSMWKPAGREISLNGTKEVAEAMLKRYEKSFS